MSSLVVQILGVVGIGCRAIVLPAKSSGLSHKRWHTACGAPPTRYKRLSCHSIEDVADHDFSGGVIIAGQGGSATRAAQEVVDFADRTFFGELDLETYDSCATRWARAFWNREDILNITGTVNYSITDIPKELRSSVKDQTCKSLAILKQMATDYPEESKGRLWALKDPWLRFMLPFYTSKLNVKFIHVTRDLRLLLDTKNDEHLSPHFQDLEMFANFGDARLPREMIGSVYDAGKNAFSKLKDSPDFEEMISVEEVQRYAMFAQVWAIVELTLYKSWKEAQPENYFHISETKMTNASTNRKFAKKLARFLGNSNPSEDTLNKMLGVYRPDEFTPEKWNHWKMMQAIIEEPSNGMIREALNTFGYKV